jgi:hypothetical protein
MYGPPKPSGTARRHGGFQAGKEQRIDADQVFPPGNPGLNGGWLAGFRAGDLADERVLKSFCSFRLVFRLLSYETASGAG